MRQDIRTTREYEDTDCFSSCIIASSYSLDSVQLLEGNGFLTGYIEWSLVIRAFIALKTR